ncbi:hypothetical protein EHS25_002111 [Saitozyma podzolica]|uniref:HpcH/HpaI aldolase/citrate lyase domain-containing protein n=1 Tax=Saitozyma podzolica TaxID=1890683 RepID=A0A427YER1_9TREE|nr:hypothetical protein EHS25_002111 [Saitozyma podzolica]
MSSTNTLFRATRAASSNSASTHLSAAEATGRCSPHTRSGYRTGTTQEMRTPISWSSCRIESREGIENVEEIAYVEGVDVLFIGPFDLCKFMNVPFGSEEHEAAIQRVLQAAMTAGKGAAIFRSDGETANKRLGQGFDMASTCTDAAAVIAQFRREYQAARGSTTSKSGSVY